MSRKSSLILLNYYEKTSKSVVSWVVISTGKEHQEIPFFLTVRKHKKKKKKTLIDGQ